MVDWGRIGVGIATGGLSEVGRVVFGGGGDGAAGIAGGGFLPGAPPQRYEMEDGFLVDTIGGSVWRYDEKQDLLCRVLTEEEVYALKAKEKALEALEEAFGAMWGKNTSEDDKKAAKEFLDGLFLSPIRDHRARLKKLPKLKVAPAGGAKKRKRKKKVIE